jgi:hypothetical protein
MAAPGTDDPYERIAPLFQGTIQHDRRGALRALLGAAGGAVAALGASFGALAPAAAAAAETGAAPHAPADWVRRSGKVAKPGVLPYVRMYAGPDRITRVERRDIVLTDEPTPGLLIQPAETFAIRVIPPGTAFDWHKPSRPRITALLRGRAVFTLRDGTQGVVLPGTISLVENVDSDGHRGEFHPDEYTITVDVGLPMPRTPG